MASAPVDVCMVNFTRAIAGPFATTPADMGGMVIEGPVAGVR
jgi:hypothetical protein